MENEAQGGTISSSKGGTLSTECSRSVHKGPRLQKPFPQGRREGEGVGEREGKGGGESRGKAQKQQVACSEELPLRKGDSWRLSFRMPCPQAKCFSLSFVSSSSFKGSKLCHFRDGGCLIPEGCKRAGLLFPS